MQVKEETINKITIEKSEFICYMNKCNNEDEYKTYLQQIRKKHYDATHVCSACIIDNIKRSSDDSEPSGTAGKPILNVLEKNNLNKTCALVVRYFGGIKLGAGGLTRAYSSAVIKCLEKAVLIDTVKCKKYSISLPYELANKIEYYLKNNTKIINIIYEEDIKYEFAIERNDIIDTIKEYTKGKEPEYLGIIELEKIVK